jgi:hypothetical protein
MGDAARIAQLEAALAAALAQAAAGAAPAPLAAPPVVGIDPALVAYHQAMLSMTMRAQAGAAPTFAGNKGAGLETRKWLTGMQRWFDRAGVALDGERLIIVGTQLTGPAQVWWTGELSKALGDATRITTWAQFEAACTARWQLVDAGSVLRAQLAALQRKPGLSVTAYTEQFLELVAMLPDMSEADRVFQYKQGLNPAVHTLIAALVLPTLREVTDAAMRADAHRTAAQGSSTSGASSSGSSSGGGRNFGRFAARVAQMESDESASPAQLDLVADMASSFAELEARLNAIGSTPSFGRGGKSQRGRGGGRRGTSPPGGSVEGSSRPSRGPGLNPGPTPGLTSGMAHQRVEQRLCIRCGRDGHFKTECTNDAFVTSVKNPSSN